MPVDGESWPIKLLRFLLLVLTFGAVALISKFLIKPAFAQELPVVELVATPDEIVDPCGQDKPRVEWNVVGDPETVDSIRLFRDDVQEVTWISFPIELSEETGQYEWVLSGEWAPFRPRKAGTYDFRYMRGGTEVARSNTVTVHADAGLPVIELTPVAEEFLITLNSQCQKVFQPPIAVEWSVSGNEGCFGSDAIYIFQAGAENGQLSNGWMSRAMSVDFSTDSPGTVHFKNMLATPGEYEFRYFTSDPLGFVHGNFEVTNSVPFRLVLDENSFLRGDPNADLVIEPTDAILILGYLFLGLPATLECEDAADVNNSDDVNVTDAVILLRHMFLGTATPAAPFPACGKDPGEVTGTGTVPEPDKLTCEVQCG